MKKLILFDFDGTLADTSEGIRACYNETAVSMGFLPRGNRDDFFGIIGGSLEHGFVTLWPEMTDSQIGEAVIEYRRLYSQKGVLKPVYLYPGMKETLDSLQKKGYLLGVATLKHSRFAGELLEKLSIQKYFTILCAYTGSETKRDLLELACQKAKTNPSECLLVGDSPFDGEGAKAFGMDFAAALYGWGFRTKQEALAYHPVICLKSPSDLLNIL